MTPILLIEDEERIARFVTKGLKAEGFSVTVADTGQEGLGLALTGSFDLIILDLGLPDIDGVEVLRRIRRTSRVPVVVLSARRASDDKVEALDEGADDFVTKPFGSDEFMARVRAALRRGESVTNAATPPFVTAHFVLDFATASCEVAGQPVHLTPTEWRFLEELARHDGRLVPHADLLRSVWGPGYGRESNYLRVYANQVRRKLEPDPTAPRHLLTEPGMGYRLVR